MLKGPQVDEKLYPQSCHLFLWGTLVAEIQKKQFHLEDVDNTVCEPFPPMMLFQQRPSRLLHYKVGVHG